MTTKEYILKYKLNESDKFNHSEFIQDLTSEFIVLLELNKAQDNIKGFENATRCIRMKFDAISNKTLGILPEKLWGFFFATVVAKLRDKLCPRDMEKRNRIKEEKKKEYENRKQWESQYDNFWNFNFFDFLFSSLLKSSKPIECFKVLGLSEDASSDDVKLAYKN